MMEEELIKIWQSSPHQERVKFEKSRLIIDVQSSMDRFNKQIKYRDLREQIAVAFIVPVFAYAAYALPNLLSKIASLLIIGYALYVLLQIQKAKKHKPGKFTESYLEYLHQMRDYLHVQKHLLDTVLYWYILPGVILTMLFFMGFGVTGRLKAILKMALFNVILAIATYLLNKRAVKMEILPRLAKIDQLISVLEKS